LRLHCLFLFAALALPAAPGLAQERYAALVWDLNSGETLFAEKADERRFPASLTKMMTLYRLFDELKEGAIALDTELIVSTRASRQPPTKLGLRPGQTIKVEDAILALVTKSANDVAVVVAEALAGSEEAFAEQMTAAAEALGMRDTQFRNASGLPHPEQVTTARDMARLGAALQVRHPDTFAYFSTRTFVFAGKTIRSHNRLPQRINGVNGIKTGYTRASGFNIVSSLWRNDRSVVAVVMGGSTAKARDDRMAALLKRHVGRAAQGKQLHGSVRALASNPDNET